MQREAFAHLRKRSEKAWGIANTWHTTIKDAYRWVLPERYTVASTGRDGQPNYSNLFDSTGQTALTDFAAFVTEALYPFDQEWFRFAPKDTLPNGAKDILRPMADKFTLTVRQLIDESNFHSAILAANKDLSLGTRFLRIDLDPYDETRIVFAAMLPTTFAIDEDRHGVIAGVFMKIKIRGVELERMFPGGEFSDQTRRQIEKDPECEVEICEAVTRIDDGWQYCAWEAGTAKDGAADVIVEQYYMTSPITVTRWSKTIGQAWGVGPSVQMLPDIKTADKVVELTLKNAAIAVTGIWLADDDGVLNPANIKLVPGSIIPKAVGSAGLTPLEAPGRFDVSQIVLEELRAKINMAHYVVKLPDREMTAYEASERTREEQRRLRGVFGQLRSEDVEPVLRRVIDLGQQMGRIPNDPRIRLLDLELVGPLAQAMRENRVRREIEAYQTVRTLFGPEAAAAAFKLQNMIPDMLSDLGISSDHYGSSAEFQRNVGTLTESAAQAAQLALPAPGQQPAQ